MHDNDGQNEVIVVCSVDAGALHFLYRAFFKAPLSLSEVQTEPKAAQGPVTFGGICAFWEMYYFFQFYANQMLNTFSLTSGQHG